MMKPEYRLCVYHLVCPYKYKPGSAGGMWFSSAAHNSKCPFYNHPEWYLPENLWHTSVLKCRNWELGDFR